MKNKIIDAVKAHAVIYIYRHEKPDPDAVGSQGGLASLIKFNCPDKQIHLVGENENSLSFLANSDSDHAEPEGNALVIVCDTANTERIDGKGWDKGTQLVKIDHHPNVDPYGDIAWVDTKASSTCEMIIELAMHAAEVEKWKLPKDAARLLYAGIVGDTGRFQHSNTTPRTHRMAAAVLEHGVDTTSLYTEFYKNSEAVVRLRGKVLQEFTLTEEGTGMMYLTKDTLAHYNISINESSAVINAFADTDGILAWVFFVENDDSTYRVRLRSKGPVINDIAAEHNGGGHPMAAGAKAENLDETKQVMKKLQAVCHEWKKKNNLFN
ncbi:bifunctional oligoribonuclease/PAP phosphatase NrnA [Alteribacillus sp. HJP-4]|uniref:DHH family phosphoesterase n=1 Tax=Alteribacillus sp. HJP-4 TaxID=2775394 RepID=UPI0035CCE98E